MRLPKAFENALSADGWTRVLADDTQRFLFAGVIPEDLLSENVLSLGSRKRWSDRVKIVSRPPGLQEWRWVACRNGQNGSIGRYAWQELPAICRELCKGHFVEWRLREKG